VIKTSTLVIAILVIIVLVLAGFILKDFISVNIAGEDDQEQTEETTTGSESETTTAAGGTTTAPTTTAAGTTTASTTASTTTATSATTASTTTTTIATTAGKPDLTLTSGGLVDMFVLPGETITISGWTVKNAGTVASGDFSNGFYLSNDATITSGDTYLDGNSNPSLAPGEQFVWGNTTLTIPAGTPPGSYHIGILVDRNNAVSESNENNNYWSTVIVVEASP
jgi:subtilase family serine protease